MLSSTSEPNKFSFLAFRPRYQEVFGIGLRAFELRNPCAFIPGVEQESFLESDSSELRAGGPHPFNEANHLRLSKPTVAEPTYRKVSWGRVDRRVQPPGDHKRCT